MKNLLIILTTLLVGMMFYSCRQSVNDALKPNQAPNTYLFLFPDSTISKQPSSLKVHWSGDDPDGLIVGYYFKWNGLDSKWHFTSSNDSTFSLYIGTQDTTYDFEVSSVDNDGNGVYDNKIVQNGIDYGPEPFVDQNGDGKYEKGEPFTDIGAIDPSPASLNIPIKNSTPTISWNSLSVLPDSSYPVMTLGWNANDLDGEESIIHINIALNDTTKFVSLDGATRLITIRPTDFNSDSPDMDILINASASNVFSQKLKGLKLNADNRIYIQAEDISGAKSNFVALPDTSQNWYVKKPKGNLLIVDSYHPNSQSSDQEAEQFYDNAFSQIDGGAFSGKFDKINMFKTILPYENITFWETLKLFKYVYWYTDAQPPLSLLNYVTNNFTNANGKIAFSMTFADSSSTFPFDLSSLQGFLPIDSLGQKNSVNFLLRNADIVPSNSSVNFPSLKTSATTSYVRTFVPNKITANRIYDISSSQIKGNIGFETKDKNLFFIGIPLHLANGGNGNVVKLLDKIFIDEFGMSQ